MICENMIGANRTYLIETLMICENREGLRGKTPNPPRVHGCVRWMRWIKLVDHHS